MKTLKMTAKEIKEACNIIWTNENDVLEIFFSTKLNKFVCCLNDLVMQSSKGLTSSLSAFNSIAKRLGLTKENEIIEF